MQLRPQLIGILAIAGTCRLHSSLKPQSQHDHQRMNDDVHFHYLQLKTVKFLA